MRQTNITYGALLSFMVLFVLLVHFYQPSEKVFVGEITTRTELLLDAQQVDIEDFENQLSIYTNPFGIEDEGRFEKRVFLNGGLIYWNSTDYLPDYTMLKKPEQIYPLWDETGLKIIRRHEVVANRDLIEIFSIIHVLKIPPVNNQYLENELNEDLFQNQVVSINGDGIHQVTYKGTALFSFDIGIQNQELAEWFELVMILLITGVMIYWVMQSGDANNWLWCIAILMAGRLVLFGWSLLSVSSLDLFNPIFFTHGALNHSLGDLALNALLILVILSLVYWKFAVEVISTGRQFSLQDDWLAVIGGAIASVGFTCVFYQSVWMILEHSQVNLDISDSILFDELRMVVYLVIVVLGICFLLVFTFSVQLFQVSQLKYWWHGGVVLLSSFFGMLIVGKDLWLPLSFLLILFGLVKVWKLGRVINTIRYQSFIYLVIVFAFLSSIFSFSVYKHFEKDELIAKERFASRLLIRNDILGEYYLSQILEDIANDRYVRTRLLSRLLARQNIREKIKRQFLSSYFKKYDINVYLFDVGGESLQENNTSYQEWQEEYIKDEFSTDYEHIYFVEDKAENVRNKYVCFIDITAYGREVGHIVLDLTLKKYIPSSVFPELLLESKYYMGSKVDYDYGVFKNGEILFKQGRVTFENKLSGEDFRNPKLFESGLEQGGYHYLGMKTKDQRIMIIVSPNYEIQSVLSNFSFVFLLLLFFVGLIFITVRIVSQTSRLNLSTKIQLFLGLSFLLPMIVVSVALINTLNRSYKEEIDRNFRETSFNVAENLIDQSEAFFTSSVNIDDYTNEIAKAATLAQSDLNIYDVNGRLVATSQPEIFRLGLLSGLLNPEALYKINQKREQNIIVEQHIGKLDFKTSYTALRSYRDGRLLAILAIPYFDSKNHLRRQQVEVFNNLVVIFSFIFLVSLIGGNFIVGQLVKPLKRIGDRISKTSLQETNEPIQYDAQDEIGSLVKEYNKMLLKLEESKEALAVSQKESAWKEIARQVAHEIKNPLTPMRLKIQQLMRHVESDSREYKAYITLITQVDSLSSIADSFSEFAKMPAPKPEKVNLIHLVENTLDLYHGQDAKIYRDFKMGEAEVFIDPKIFSRTLTNIILNAIQAVEDQQAVIHISTSPSGGKVLLTIKDNGKGIPDEQREKIFTPYFSTKTTGSGIGLAVAKKGIENAGGNIWFESEAGEGTSFFITLPLHHS